MIKNKNTKFLKWVAKNALNAYCLKFSLVFCKKCSKSDKRSLIKFSFFQKKICDKNDKNSIKI